MGIALKVGPTHQAWAWQTGTASSRRSTIVISMMLAGVNPSLDDELDPVTVVIQEDADKPVENIGIERADGALDHTA